MPPLPILIEQLPDDSVRPPQTRFSAERQARFIEHVSTTGSARSAARAASVSHQTVYRMRRANGPFRRAWDAALLVARAHSEAVLADRAHDGVLEPVWFHGEKVGERRRYDSRLLLAHLGRLDKLEERPDAAMLADSFDEVIEALREGRALPAEPLRAAPPASSSGRCNTRSMSRETAGRPPACDCVGERYGVDRGRAHWRITGHGPVPVENVAGRGPCCDAPSWPGCRDCPHYPVADRAHHEMDEQRPADAPPPEVLGEPVAVELCQRIAFESDDAEWWRYGEDWTLYEADGEGGWRPEREASERDAAPEETAAPPPEEEAREGAGEGSSVSPCERNADAAEPSRAADGALPTDAASDDPAAISEESKADAAPNHAAPSLVAERSLPPAELDAGEEAQDAPGHANASQAIDTTTGRAEPGAQTAEPASRQGPQPKTVAERLAFARSLPFNRDGLMPTDRGQALPSGPGTRTGAGHEHKALPRIRQL